MTAIDLSGPGSDNAEVWIPPFTDCMDYAHDPCPHCGSRVHHARTNRCGDCGRRPAPPVQAAVMPCSGCRVPLNLSDMVWLSGGRVGCAQCARRGK